VARARPVARTLAAGSVRCDGVMLMTFLLGSSGAIRRPAGGEPNTPKASGYSVGAGSVQTIGI